MKLKIISVALLAFSLTACVPEQLVKTVYVEKKVPVNAVPAPPPIQRPVYETSKLTPEDRKDIGIVTQAVTVESKQKDGYIEILETIINTYKDMSEKAEIQVPPLTLPEGKVVVGEPESVVGPTP